MERMTQWLLRCVALVAMAIAIGALSGCASTGADGASAPTRDNQNDQRDPFDNGFSA